MKNNEKRKIKILFVFAAIFVCSFIIWLFFDRNKPEEWLESDLDKCLVCNQIKQAEYKSKEKTTTIIGKAINKNNKEFRFITTIGNNWFEKYFYNNNFSKDKDNEKMFPLFYVKIKNNILIDDNNKVKICYQHRSYKECFNLLINEYKNKHPEDDKVGFSTCDAFKISYFKTVSSNFFLSIIRIFTFMLILFIFKNTFSNDVSSIILKTGVNFNDIAGYEEEKNEFKNIIKYLKNPKYFLKFNAKLPKGVLLIGPPGTGKTLLAKAVASEAGVPFFAVSGSNFEEVMVGLGASRIRELFKRARMMTPSIIFIDEIDTFAKNRDKEIQQNSVFDQTINQFLAEMDGFPENSGIIVIAATNRENVLDPALTRSGRFDKHIRFHLPNKIEREAIFKLHAKNKPIDKFVDFKKLASYSMNCSCADIANIMNEAAILAINKKHEVIKIDDITEAFENIFIGIAKKNNLITEKEKKIIAYHESGHAIIGITLPDSEKIQKISIIPRGHAGGYVITTPKEEKMILTYNELFARIVMGLGGIVAEKIFFKDHSCGVKNDIENVTKLARAMVIEFGMSKLGPISYFDNDFNYFKHNFSDQTNFKIDEEIKKIIDSALLKAEEIIITRKNDVVLIANKLLEQETIDANEIDGILNENNKNNDENNDNKKYDA